MFVQKIISKARPWMIENSKVPVFLSYFAPITIWAISFGPFVWCRGEMTEETKRHETIHYHQHLELLFIGFWLLYVSFWIRGLFKKQDGAESYRSNPFEVEAYTHESEEDYLEKRKLFSWVKYI